jgi:2-keto-4-pentenoate hydratase/2-oxohepta-3-ene-1,7-dioic acid hydratase in catechol pathway
LHICKDGYQINQTEAESYFDAYTIGIDFTARDIQKKLKEKGLPWEKAKAWDNSAIVGNWFSFPENDKQLPIAFSLKKNEEIVQLGNTKEMIFSFKEVIENISKYFTINKGDLIFTGTPAGVGSCKPGDQLKGLIKENIALDLQVL